MSKSRLLAGVALAALCLPVAALSPGLPLGVSTAQAQSAVSFQVFFDQLEPHGVWVRHARYNYVFCPTGVDASWRPYTHGRWLYMEDRGWYFASDEPFAWATYHYGRWFADQKLGWCWVPGTKWAPAWVSWRRSDRVVGWAPLPPEGDGYAVSIEVSRRDLPEGYWVFVPTERFVEPDLSVSIVIGSQQPDYYTQTEFLGPVVVEGGVVTNNVIDVTYIEQTINQQVIIYQPQEVADPAAQAVNVDAKAIAIFDQDIAEPAAEAAPPEPVEEAEAAATIETEGGTAGTTADLPDEAGAATEAPDASAQPEEPAAVQPSDQRPAPSEDATAPSESSGEPAPAEEVPVETKAPLAADQPAAEGSSGQPAEGKPAACAPDAMVDGKCPPAADQPAVAPDANAQKSEQSAPAPEAAPAPADTTPDATPAPETATPTEPAPEAAPAPAAKAPPADEPAAQDAASPKAAAPDSAPACPPEAMVDGKCPTVPAQPAQQ